MGKIEHRYYQKEAIEGTYKGWWELGHKSVLVILPTAAGKTVIFTSLTVDVLTKKHPNARFLIVAHRSELLGQCQNKIIKNYPEFFETFNPLCSGPRIAILNGDAVRKTYDAQITVASIQTLAYQDPKTKRYPHLEKLLEHGAIDYIIIDEAHHAVSPSYTTALDGMWNVNPGMKLLGVTATPIRSDGIALANVFDYTAVKYEIPDLVKTGFLTPPRWCVVETKIKIHGGKRSGEYTKEQLREFEDSEIRSIVVATHKQHAHERQGMVFCATVEGAKAMAEAFQAAGYTAAFADGTTDKKEREQILKDFEEGKIQLLVNVGIWTEGLDAPNVSVVHIARPTRSVGLFLQMAGRGLRLAPNKANCLIIEYQPDDEARNIGLFGDALGKPIGREKLAKFFAKAKAARKAGEAEDLGQLLFALDFDGDDYSDASGLDLNAIEVELKEIQITEDQGVIWHYQDGMHTLGLGADREGVQRILIVENNVLYGLRKPKNGTWSKPRVLAVPEAGELAVKLAWPFIKQHGQQQLIKKDSAWGNSFASPSQLRFLASIGANYLTDEQMKLIHSRKLRSSEASKLITYSIARNALIDYNNQVADWKEVAHG